MPGPGDDLLEAAREGDPAAWQDLVRFFETDLLNFAARRGVPEPRDVVQDVFSAAAEGLGDFDGNWSQFRSWLFTVAHRRVADVHRRRYRGRELLTADPSDDAPATPQDDVEERAADAESVTESIAALAVLDERERAVLLGRIIEDRSAADIADRLGLSAVNVRVIQSRALTKVRRHLQASAASPSDSSKSKRSRNAAAPTAIALGAMTLSDRAHAFVGTLPSDELLGGWIDRLRADVADVLGPDASAADVAALVEHSGTAAPVSAGSAAVPPAADVASAAQTATPLAAAGSAAAAASGGTGAVVAAAATVALAVGSVVALVVVGTTSTPEPAEPAVPTVVTLDPTELDDLFGTGPDVLDGVTGVVPSISVDLDPGLDADRAIEPLAELLIEPADRLLDDVVPPVTTPTVTVPAAPEFPLGDEVGELLDDPLGELPDTPLG